MACIHHNMGCEWPFVEPLIRHINATEGTDYEHHQCLDHGGNESQRDPQPEALYIGEKSGLLTIEKKRLEWPPGIIKRHQFWHKLADELHAVLAPLTLDGPYKLSLPEELPVHNRDLSKALKAIVEAIERNIDQIRPGGKVLRRQKPIPFRFYRQERYERNEDDPQDGLVIETSRSMLNDLAAIEDDKILEVVKRYLKACSKKFAIWGNTRRVLLLEPHGSFVDVVLNDAPWSDLVNGEVDEVWAGSYYKDPSLGGWLENWFFERLYG